MLVLGIETATPVCGAALADDEVLVGEYTVAGDTHHSERLMEMIDHLLRSAGRERGDIEGVAVSSGPGSFTGLRIGMGAAKGICMGLGVPLKRVSTLAGLALRTGGTVPVCPMLDARRGEVYCGLLAVAEREVSVVLEDTVCPVGDVLRRLPDTPVLFTGEGAFVYQEEILARRPEARFAPRVLASPTATAIAVLGARALAAGEADDPDVAEPDYHRRSQAERLRDGKTQA